MPTPVQDVRRLHRRLVLRALRDHGPQPRADLARRLGLSPTTMTKVVGQLLGEGLVAEGATDGAGTRVGRPSTEVRLRTDARHVIGVQVGAGTVRLGRCDLKARPLEVRSFAFDLAGEPPERVVRRIAEAAAALAGDRLLGIGVAAPGPVDPGSAATCCRSTSAGGTSRSPTRWSGRSGCRRWSITTYGRWRWPRPATATRAGPTPSCTSTSAPGSGPGW
ncbi:Mlc, transcriptional repressor of MalT (the transcriptional activator of maltose regulon) and manXYZ operon [[Actinomadura] parvosata subsp. kistnae]|nr:Mlc, transcriptional repressor of MalT (the transcriptional activator of maltose regulon) and manXYZ operon [Actinomadura parvosata subsp. kistnae]